MPVQDSGPCQSRSQALPATQSRAADGLVMSKGLRFNEKSASQPAHLENSTLHRKLALQQHAGKFN